MGDSAIGLTILRASGSGGLKLCVSNLVALALRIEETSTSELEREGVVGREENIVDDRRTAAPIRERNDLLMSSVDGFVKSDSRERKKRRVVCAKVSKVSWIGGKHARRPYYILDAPRG